MPPLDDLEMGTESSTAPDLDAGKAQPEAKPDAKPDAESSTAGEGKSDDGLLSVVRDVVDKAAKKPEAEKPEPAAEPESSDDGDTAQKAESDEYSDVPFHKHPRFQQLLRKTKAFEEDAGRYRNVQTFLDSNGLGAEEAAEALIVAGLAKTNPAEAWARIKPWVQKIVVAAGEVIPDDLNRMVQAGQMSREAALEVSRSRAQVQSIQTYQTFNEQRAERMRQEAAAQALVDTAASWEADRHAKDPNFGAKIAPLQREIAFLHQTEGRPTTPDGVKDQLKRAYAAVNKSFRPPEPPPAAKPAIKPVTGGQVSGSVQPKPSSTLDIIRSKVRVG